MNIRTLLRTTVMLLCVASVAIQAWARPLESKRMERAKDLIADEQWLRAIDELKAAAADRQEPNRDEALFWLAHSLNQARDSAAAVETIHRLEREFPASRWVKPARSLRIEIAQRLNRNDFLWYTAAPPPPVPAAAPAPPAAAPAPPVGVTMPVPAPRTPRPSRVASPPSAPAPPPTAIAPFAPAAPPPPPPWVPENYFPDMDMRIQAMASLIRTDAPKVIPMLREIALESGNVDEARRALFVLAQSGRPEARTTVIEVAKRGPELVRLAAVRELGRLEGPAVATELLQVYSSADERVKFQVLSALGQRDDAAALVRIAQSEKDTRLRDVAIVRLGEAGGRQQLATLYSRSAPDAKRAIIVGLFNARAEDELIRIAERESDPALQQEVRTRLRLLGTPGAKAYLDAHR
jgi:hypothetical protein